MAKSVFPPFLKLHRVKHAPPPCTVASLMVECEWKISHMTFSVKEI